MGLLCADSSDQPGPTVMTAELDGAVPTVRCAPAASGRRLATALFSRGQPAVRTAMTATTMSSQRSLSLITLAAGRVAVSSAATKQLAQAIGAATEEGNDEGGQGDENDGDGDQPQSAG